MGGEPLHVFVFGCVSCGKTVAGNEKSCPRCGASFEEVRFECPFCGELISPTDKKCPSCGTEFGAFADEVLETCSLDLDGADLEEERESVETGASGAPEPVAYECPNCGKPVAEDDDECPHCGARFSEG